MKESPACRLFGSWSFTRRHTISYPPSPFFFDTLLWLFLTPVDVRTSLSDQTAKQPAKGRLTMPIRKDRAAAPLHMHCFKFVHVFSDCLHRLLCKQMSFSCCAGSTTWRDLLRAARQGRACIFGNMSTSKRTSRQLKASQWLRVTGQTKLLNKATSSSLRHQQMAP